MNDFIDADKYIFDVDNDYISISDDESDDEIDDEIINEIEHEIENDNDNEIINDNDHVIQKIDRKSEITIDFMMIIGKYYKNNIDFINTMKISKMYQELVSMYKFNPISDTILFENLETQHFYKDNDLEHVLKNKFQYINWTNKYFTNKTKLVNNNKLVYEEEENYEDVQGEMIFKDSKRPNDRFFNKRSLFNFDIANKFNFINDNKLIITKEFSELDQISGKNDLYSDIIEINISDNVTFIPKRCFIDLLYLTTIVFPRNIVTLRYKTVCNCPSLNRIYISPSLLYYGDRIFYKTEINEIILSKYFTENDFYNYFRKFQAIISAESVYGVSMEEERPKTVNIIVRRIKPDINLFRTRVSVYLSGPITLNKNEILTSINNINVKFIFTDKIEEGYIDY